MTWRGRPVAAALTSALLGAGCGVDPEKGGSTREPRPAVAAAATAPKTTASAPEREGDLGARLIHAAFLRDRPGGRVVARLGTRTEFGSPRVMPVVRRRPGWLGVISAARPNGRVGWVAERRARLVAEPVRVEISLSQRRLRVVRDGRTIHAMPVGVGRPGHATPTGRFAVTDGLRARRGGPYGCCILALSGHQPETPQGWTGGDRIAVHGTTNQASVGQAASAGCLRAKDADVRRLLELATLGARVRIRR